MTADLDLDAIAKRIDLAREVYGADFTLGTVEFASGELTPRATVDILRDLDRVALFREVRRLRLVLQDAAVTRQLVREAYEALTNPEGHVDLRDWLKTAAPFAKPSTVEP